MVRQAILSIFRLEMDAAASLTRANARQQTVTQAAGSAKHKFWTC